LFRRLNDELRIFPGLLALVDKSALQIMRRAANHGLWRAQFVQMEIVYAKLQLK